MFTWLDSFAAWEPWIRWLVSAAYVAFFIGIAYLARFVFTRVVPLFTRRTKTNLDDFMVEALSLPIFIIFIVLGLWLGISRATELANYTEWITKSFVTVYILVAAFAVYRVVDTLLKWYGSEIAIRTASNLDDRLVPILRRISGVIIFGITIVVILGQFGVQISPLLAALGIGGLAIALALQPTLSNFLAGTYVMTDSVTRSGDYIQLDNGVEGFVEKVGWRTTRIRHWQGNIITLPNSKLAEAIVTNYEEPDKSMFFTVDCWVSYGSDLEKVEKVTLEVALEVMQRLPEGAKDSEPVVRFKSFGDSNISFAVVMKSVDRLGYFMVKHEFIKALHKRYSQEGIEIQYPARKIYFAGNTGQETRAKAIRVLNGEAEEIKTPKPKAG
jgi:small-conductance mechanosensitive channel